ncbi:copper resistance protein CopC [Paenibacillus sp. PL2-23]|uniref:copper resistance CopC family protein n=1 Tax=Paenibacillus sp. PL2-23 TaxID=2100729 RepID=UPI0030F72A6F
MKRFIMILAAALMLLLPSTAMAHSKLTSAIPAVDSTIDVSPASIDMVFDTRIEKISSFKLYNEGGEQLETGDSVVSNDKMTGSIPSPLTNGLYTVKWTIIGADGHAVEGEYSFTVDAPAQAPAPSPSPVESPASTPSAQAPAAVSPEPTASVEQDEDAEKEDPLQSLASSPAAALGGIIVVATVLVLMFRRRKP